MPTVTELRKAGNLDEALAQGLAALAAKPNDVWAKRHLAWVYHDQLKLSATEDTVAFLKALGGLVRLELRADEEMVFTNVLWQVVRRLYAFAKASHPIGAWVKAGIPAEGAWTRNGLPSSDCRLRQQTEAQQLLAQVAKLPYGRPCEAHSALLKAMLHLREKACPLKLLLASPLADVLRPEDFRGEEYEGRKQKSLAEQAYTALARELVAEASQYPAEIAAFLPQLDAVIARQPSYQWLPFFKVKLQLAGGDAAAALPTLLPIVRQKSGEFWVWNLLAETLETTDPAAALACLYRASTCGSEEKFLGKVRLKLARQLATTHPGEARWQLEKIRAAYAAEGWPIKGEALTLATLLRDQLAAPAETTRPEWLHLAEQTTYGDLPWQPVVLQFISEETAEHPVAMARLLAAGANTQPIGVPLKKYRWLKKLPVGSPLQIRTEAATDRIRVVQLVARPEGQLWDTLPGHIAVVNGFVPDKSLAFFAVRPGLSGAFRPAEFQISGLLTGDVLHLRLQAKTKDGETRHYVLAAERSEATPNERICRRFSGPLELHENGFGFADDVFLPAPFIAQHGWQRGDTVSGRAVLQHNKKKGKDGWNVAVVD